MESTLEEVIAMWWSGGWWVLPLLCLGMMALCLLAGRLRGCCGMEYRDAHGSSEKREG